MNYLSALFNPFASSQQNYLFFIIRRGAISFIVKKTVANTDQNGLCYSVLATHLDKDLFWKVAKERFSRLRPDTFWRLWMLISVFRLHCQNDVSSRRERWKRKLLKVILARCPWVKTAIRYEDRNRKEKLHWTDSKRGVILKQIIYFVIEYEVLSKI